MIDLLAEGDSLDKTLRELVDSQTVVTGSEMGSVTDLTATQIAIPSQEEPQEVSPTSEVQSEVLHHEFSCRLIVATGDHLQDSDSIIQVRGPATVKEVVHAEIAIAKWQHVEFQCWSEGEVIDMHSSLKPDMVLSLVVVSEFTSQLDHNSSGEEPELQVVASDEVNHPLTQIKGKAFLNMLPPQVTKVSQAEALRSQKISFHDRSKVLLNQELLWGDDEILWHLERVCQEIPVSHRDQFGKIAVLDPLLTSSWATGLDCGDFPTWLIAKDHPQGIVTALVMRGHWIPLVMVREHDFLLAFAVGDDETDQKIIRNFVDSLGKVLSLPKHECTFKQTPFCNQCCGAFVIAFVEYLLKNQPLPVDQQELISLHDYCRTLFMTTVRHLCPHPWTWGAGKDAVGPVVEKLIHYLQEHGVGSDQVQSRAQAAVKAIGATDVAKAIDSNNPWRNIKSLANNVKFQLVLQTELQQHIAGKAGKEVGKVTKKARAQRVPKQPDSIVLDPCKLQIPDGTFCSEGKELQQLTPNQIGPVAMGVVVLSLEEADPFLKANQIVSKAPLALLVLNAPSYRWSTQLLVSQVTCPARCIMNQEPLLLEASLVQIGTGVVEKKQGVAELAIETVKVSTLKVMVYKDEVQLPWDTFVNGPVKYIVSQIPTLKLCQEKDCKCPGWHNHEQEQVSAAIVDVWRRQYLRQGFKPEAPAAASIFTVCIRVPTCIRDQIIGSAGFGGVYVEPRTLDAKEIDRSFDVVWVPRADKSSVSHLRQTNPLVAGITRLGDRWGLRVRADQAQVVHQSVRPDAVFLEQGPRLQYSVSPIPFGTDRQALSRALKSSGWEVKPIQPVGSVEGGRGNTWNVVATKPPPSNIIPMSHGEVVISTVKALEKAKSETMKPVAASSTLNLCGTGRLQSSGLKDPWVMQDPWQSYQGPRPENVTRGALDASDSLKQLEQKIEQAVLSKVPQVACMEQDDVPDRVAVLEKQVNSLMSKQQQIEVSIQDHHAHHAAQLSQLQGQLNAQGQQVAGQLESQQQNIKSMFDSQMAQIRGLLAKRPREDGE